MERIALVKSPGLDAEFVVAGLVHHGLDVALTTAPEARVLAAAGDVRAVLVHWPSAELWGEWTTDRAVAAVPLLTLETLEPGGRLAWQAFWPRAGEYRIAPGASVKQIARSVRQALFASAQKVRYARWSVLVAPLIAGSAIRLASRLMGREAPRFTLLAGGLWFLLMLLDAWRRGGRGWMLAGATALVAAWVGGGAWM